MPTCSFCGHASHDGARTCVACGNVLTPPAPPGDPELPPGDAEVRAELTALASPAATDEPAGPTPASREEAGEGEGGLAALFDPDPLRAATRQATILMALAGALTVASAVTVALDLFDALDALGPGAFLNRAVELTGRYDRVTLAEISLAIGALVMLGGWAQQVAANRALLGTASSDRGSRQVLLAFLIPGLNAITAGPMMLEMWRDATPAGGDRSPAGLVRAWPVLFGVGVGTRLAVGVWAVVAFPTLTTRSDAWTAALVLIAGRAAWLLALVATVPVMRSLTRRQIDQARAAA